MPRDGTAISKCHPLVMHSMFWLCVGLSHAIGRHKVSGDHTLQYRFSTGAECMPNKQEHFAGKVLSCVPFCCSLHVAPQDTKVESPHTCCSEPAGLKEVKLRCMCLSLKLVFQLLSRQKEATEKLVLSSHTSWTEKDTFRTNRCMTRLLLQTGDAYKLFAVICSAGNVGQCSCYPALWRVKEHLHALMVDT